MTTFSNYFLVTICSIAIIINVLRIIKIIFDPVMMKHPVFDFPTNKLHRVLMLLCAILVLLLFVLLKLEIVK